LTEATASRINLPGHRVHPACVFPWGTQARAQSRLVLIGCRGLSSTLSIYAA